MVRCSEIPGSLFRNHCVKVYLSLLPIVAGVVIASATELSFSSSGLAAALFSTFTYSFLNILVKKVCVLLQFADFNFNFMRASIVVNLVFLILCFFCSC